MARPFAIGFFQAAASFQGFPEADRPSQQPFSGWQKNQAIQFSFLLAIPAILGGSALEGWHAWHSPAER